MKEIRISFKQFTSEMIFSFVPKQSIYFSSKRRCLYRFEDEEIQQRLVSLERSPSIVARTAEMFSSAASAVTGAMSVALKAVCASLNWLTRLSHYYHCAVALYIFFCVLRIHAS